MTFGARALIRLGALQKNLSVIRRAAPDARVMAVIKANAYGHGMVEVAKSLEGVDAFAVARLPEALRLRESGIIAPIVLLSGVQSAAELDAAIQQGFEVVVHCIEQVDLLEACRGGQAVAWLKFDTGMNRLGFDPTMADELIARLRRAGAVGELRLMTHLASADEEGSAITREQFERFRRIVDGFAGDVSLANTAATMGWTEAANARAHFGFKGKHWIRPGIALFGISPFEGQTAAELGLTPVMHFQSRLIAVKPLREGARVGYKQRYQNQADTLIGIISAGYGDGYTRHFRSGTPVLANGRRVPLIGHVSMDMIAVDLGADAADKVGDVVTLWGDGLPVEEVAPWANAIPYELVCGVMHREPSQHVD